MESYEEMWAEYEASGARDEYESALKEAERAWDQWTDLRDLAALRTVRRSRHFQDINRALGKVRSSIDDTFHAGEFDEFNPDAVPMLGAQLELLRAAVARAVALAAEFITFALLALDPDPRQRVRRLPDHGGPPPGRLVASGPAKSHAPPIPRAQRLAVRTAA